MKVIITCNPVQKEYFSTFNTLSTFSWVYSVYSSYNILNAGLTYLFFTWVFLQCGTSTFTSVKGSEYFCHHWYRVTKIILSRPCNNKLFQTSKLSSRLIQASNFKSLKWHHGLFVITVTSVWAWERSVWRKSLCGIWINLHTDLLKNTVVTQSYQRFTLTKAG